MPSELVNLLAHGKYLKITNSEVMVKIIHIIELVAIIFETS